MQTLGTINNHKDKQMARKKYRIIVEFTYKDGVTDGSLDTVVNSKKAISDQLEANQKWLDSKGHTADNITITEITAS